MRHNRTKAMILCQCDYAWDLCVRVGLEVPESLWCPPGNPIARPSNARSDICCPKCRNPLFPSDEAFRIRVETELRRGVGRHLDRGTVVVDCR